MRQCLGRDAVTRIADRSDERRPPFAAVVIVETVRPVGPRHPRPGVERSKHLQEQRSHSREATPDLSVARFRPAGRPSATHHALPRFRPMHRWTWRGSQQEIGSSHPWWAVSLKRFCTSERSSRGKRCRRSRRPSSAADGAAHRRCRQLNRPSAARVGVGVRRQSPAGRRVQEEGGRGRIRSPEPRHPGFFPAQRAVPTPKYQTTEYLLRQVIVSIRRVRDDGHRRASAV